MRPSDAQSLNLFRFLYCISVAFTMGLKPAWFEAAVLLRYPDTFRPIQLFALLGIERVSPFAFSLIHHALLAALICAALGLLTRPALLASCIGCFLYFGTIHSAFKPPGLDIDAHQTQCVPWVLMILSVSPGVGLWGLGGWMARKIRRRPDRDSAAAIIPAWPLQAVKLLLVLIYFGAAYSKFRGSLLWSDGLALQTIFLEKAMQLDLRLGLWAAHHRGLCALLSAACLILESSFAAVLIAPALAPLYALAGLGMHAGMWALMGLNYFRYFAAIYWVFLSWPLLLRLGRFLKAVREAGDAFKETFERHSARYRPERGLRYAAVCIAAIAAANLFCIFTGFAAWPFAHWSFYGRRKNHTDAAVYRVQGISRQGASRWLAPAQLPQGSVLTSNHVAMALARRDQRWLQDRLRVIIGELLYNKKAAEFEALVVVKRTVRRSPQKRFEFVDTPLMRVPVVGGK